MYTLTRAPKIPKIDTNEVAANAIAQIFANGNLGICGIYQDPDDPEATAEKAIVLCTKDNPGVMVVAPEIATKIHELITFVRTYKPPTGGGTRLKLVA
jgi:hypothetical protein